MSATQPRRLGLALACALALMTSACVVSPIVTDGPGLIRGGNGGGSQAQGTNPVIQMLTANPMATSDKDAKITFTVVANSPTGAPLQYNWSATKGVLSSTTGQIVYWSPTKADGSLENPGDAQISVIITTSNGGSVVGTAMVKVLAGGATQVISTGAASPAPSMAPSASPSAAPTAEPTAAASTEPSASPSASPSADPSAEPTASPSAEPSASPSAEASPTASPTASPENT